ncbi:TonB-dependent receptor [Horticoccus luteus]|uniref:TonB-dependent receptor n=1 Tax=Horticoccus luteus TaxID=2862869 RepID=A0A8F9TVI9_9BACT|nr:TonB-dependent receptor [Horticoccus luteus]QYM78756.1 TonB-dependent receptor [Horticoccus luteus]
MHQHSLLKRLLGGMSFLLLALATGLYGQGITTAGIDGSVTNSSGAPISGATVTIVHEPSGTTATALTRANGQYNASGLRVGGPYTITVTGTDLTPQKRSDVYLGLGESATVNFSMNSDVVQMEAFSVTSSRDATFDSGKMGSGTSYNEEAVRNVASVRRDIQDVAAMDSRLFLGSLDQGGNLSAQGQNYRFNSLLIDGVRSDDQFGLNGNGATSLRSPIPLEAVENLSVELQPYDVRRAGFTGALINVVTKSGTNELHGSAFYEYTNEDFRAKNPVTGLRDAFKEENYGFTLGGPIIKNKLFFFGDYDYYERTSAAPQANFKPNAAQLASIIARAQALGYDPGSLSASDNVSTQKTVIGKLDWNISSDHRASFTYRRNYGTQVIFPNYTSSTATSLSNYWYSQPRNTDSYIGQLFSQWTPDLRTELDVSYTKYDGSPSNNGVPFPQVQVGGLSGTRYDTGASITNGQVYLGTESSRQLNAINTKETQVRFSADYSIGNHTVTAGVEDISTKYLNAYVQYTDGYYTFPNLAAWVAGTPVTGYTLQKANPGFSIDDAVANWRYDAYATFVQDTWKLSPQLTLLAGLRYDYPHVPEAPPVAAGFATAGFTRDNGQAVTQNNTTNNGNATIAPRIGFTYEFKTERKTQLRGGIGLFQGKNPAVWISNAYSNAGATGAVGAFNTGGIPGLTFNPDPNNQTVPAGSPPAPNINVTDPGFRQPSLWKSNLAIDHKLPFGNITFSAEGYYSEVKDALNVEFLNYKIATANSTMPDGRIAYAGTPTSGTSASSSGRRRNSSFADVFYMTNTNKGESHGVTLSLYRPMKNDWSWSASWTRGHATEVSPMTSSTASSNYSNRAVFNPNEDVASTSNTNIKDRIVIQLTRQFELIRDYKTTAAIVYQGRTGHPYSWVFRGDANGDGYTFNDLLYVPTGPNDPKVAWASTTERDAFFAYVNSTDLKNYLGTHPSRNSEVSPWQQTIDLKFTQEIPIHGHLKAELYASILNFWNIIDNKWGLQYEVPFSYRRGVAGATYNAAGNGGAGVWNYTFNSGTLDGVPTTVNDSSVSRWQAQIGMRIRF